MSALASGIVPTALRELYVKHGQDQVFRYVDSGIVKGDAVDALVAQLSDVDPGRINDLFRSTVGDRDGATPSSVDMTMKPIESFVSLDSAAADTKEEWYSAGLKAVAEGKVAVVVLSGGQGTRLGFSGPKGMYNIGLPSQKTLFQLQAERLRRVCALTEQRFPGSIDRAAGGGDKARINIPWYIMTSPLNDAITREFFAKNGYFGVAETDVFFFPQGTLPCISNPDGKIMLESAERVAMAPDGNGGIYTALQRTGALADMRTRGVEHLHVFSIDNALVKVADPYFLGYCIQSGADCGNKSVWKAEPDEKVGVVVNRGGKPCVVEYSEMDAEACERRDDSGKLVVGAGNICNHYFSRAFLEDVVLPGMGDMYHVAHKKIPAAEEPSGDTVKPTANNGIKLESFIFDVFPLSRNMVLFESPREDEFAPVKNAPGTPTDSPDTAREMISQQARRWAVAAGAELQTGGGGDGEAGGAGDCCEISPLVSYGGEGLKERVGLKKLSVPFYLKAEKDEEE